MKKVAIYTTNTCPWCEKAKSYFKSRNVQYEEFNVKENLKAREEMIEKSGQKGVPVIEIGDTIIVGFDQEAIDEALS
jgi:glutaredoxin-like YruB-family protein